MSYCHKGTMFREKDTFVMQTHYEKTAAWTPAFIVYYYDHKCCFSPNLSPTLLAWCPYLFPSLHPSLSLPRIHTHTHTHTAFKTIPSSRFTTRRGGEPSYLSIESTNCRWSFRRIWNPFLSSRNLRSPKPGSPAASPPSAWARPGWLGAQGPPTPSSQRRLDPSGWEYEQRHEGREESGAELPNECENSHQHAHAGCLCRHDNHT